MGLFSLFKSDKKQKLLNLQLLIMPDAPNRLIMSESQLIKHATQRAENDLRIMKDSIELVKTTLKPDVFFHRLNLAQETTEHLTLFEPYISFSGASPSAVYKEFLSDRDKAVNMFITRYYAAVRDKASTMKTEKGQMNQFQKFYDSLSQYQMQISQENRKYIEMLYNQAMSKRLNA